MYRTYADSLLGQSDEKGFEVLKQYVSCLRQSSAMSAVNELIEKHKDNFGSGIAETKLSEIKALYESYKN